MKFPKTFVKFVSAVLISAIITPNITSYAFNDLIYEISDEIAPTNEALDETSMEPVEQSKEESENKEEQVKKTTEEVTPEPVTTEVIEDPEAADTTNEEYELSENPEPVEVKELTFFAEPEDHGTITQTDNKLLAVPAEGFVFEYWLHGEEKLYSAEIEATEGEYIARFSKLPERLGLEKVVEGHKVTVTGQYPYDAELSVKKITETNVYKEIIDNTEVDRVVITDAFDIEIWSGGELWQPDGSVTVSISGVQTNDDTKVHRIEDDLKNATLLESRVDGDTVIFDTEHFTVFTVGTKEFNTDQGEKKWQLGDNVYGYWFETDPDTHEGIVFVTGDGTEIKSFSAFTGSDSTPFGDVDGNPNFNISEIIIDEGITSIGNYAFYGARAKKLTLPSTLTKIMGFTFQYNDFEELIFPESVVSIAGFAFGYNINLKSVKILGNTKLGMEAFTECTALTSVEMAGGSLSNVTFKNCTSLTDVSLAEGMEVIAGFNGCTALEHIVLPSTTKTIDTGAFSGCTGLTEIVIPEGVTAINTSAFYGTSLREINLPSTLKTINQNAFMNCANIESVVIPQGVSAVYGGAFKNCTSLKYVYWPDSANAYSVSSPFNGIFEGCTTLETFDISASATLYSIGTNMFRECRALKTLYIPDSVKAIRPWAFYNCGVEEIYGANQVAPAGMSTVDMGKVSRQGSSNKSQNDYASEDDILAKLGTGINSASLIHTVNYKWTSTNYYTYNYEYSIKKPLYTVKYFYTDFPKVLTFYTDNKKAPFTMGSTNYYANALLYGYDRNYGGGPECSQTGANNSPNLEEPARSTIFWNNGGTPTYASLTDAGLPAGGFNDGGGTVPVFKGNWGKYGNTASTDVATDIYAVSYHRNSADLGSTPADVRLDGAEAFMTAYNSGELKRYGYMFTGWNTKADGTGQHYDENEKVWISGTNFSNTVLYAEWKAYDYLVKFDGNGGAGEKEPIAANTASATIPTAGMLENTFTRPGYVFKNWTLNPDGPTGTRNGVTVTKSWGENDTIGNLATTAGTGAYLQDLFEAGAITLYAQWEQDPSAKFYTVRMHSNNGSGLYTDHNVLVGQKFQVPLINFTNGENFADGVTENEDGTGTKYGEGDTVNVTAEEGAVVNLYVNWKAPTVKVTYAESAKFGADVTGALPVDDYEYAAGDTVTTKDAPQNTKIRGNDGMYQFIGWNLTQDANIRSTEADRPVGSTFTITHDTTLYPIYLKENNVEYHNTWQEFGTAMTANGNVPTDSSVYLYGDTVTVKGTPLKRDLYKQIGWATTVETGDRSSSWIFYEEGDTIEMPDGTLHLYPVWEDKNAYVVDFDPNGGEGSMEHQIFEIDEERALHKNDFTRAGYYFQTWNTELNGTGTPYTDEEVVKNLAQKGDTITLYAQWIEAYSRPEDADILVIDLTRGGVEYKTDSQEFKDYSEFATILQKNGEWSINGARVESQDGTHFMSVFVDGDNATMTSPATAKYGTYEYNLTVNDRYVYDSNGVIIGRAHGLDHRTGIRILYGSKEVVDVNPVNPDSNNDETNTGGETKPGNDGQEDNKNEDENPFKKALEELKKKYEELVNKNKDSNSSSTATTGSAINHGTGTSSNNSAPIAVKPSTGATYSTTGSTNKTAVSNPASQTTINRSATTSRAAGASASEKTTAGTKASRSGSKASRAKYVKSCHL